MGMQALGMFHPHVESRDVRRLAQRLVQSARRVLAEHRVLAIGQGERLFIDALDRRLQRRAQRLLDSLDQASQGGTSTPWASRTVIRASLR